MQYRRDIDGLRAVAVVPVVFFHAGFKVFSGGFVGVDVFFVISGYLITSILVHELAAGNFSLLRFYERRIRRILPALMAVILACIPFAWMWMGPHKLEQFSRSIVAVALFASNILFWRESGYFAVGNEEKPLLHTWSLAVEEQYYVLFPLLLLIFWRFGRWRLFYLLLIISIVSLGLCEWGARNKPEANFYLAPTRAWELLTGSLCALWLFQRTRSENAILSLLGLGAIIAAIFLYDPNTPFPSVYALLPVGGVALIILFSGPDTIAGRVLSHPVLVGTGLISYSVYLWHQPLLAFTRIKSLGEPGPAVMLAMCLLSFPLGWLSWKYVETPFRAKKQGTFGSRRAILAFGVASLACLAVIGASGHLLRGIPQRFSKEMVAIDRSQLDTNPNVENCHYRVLPNGVHTVPLLPYDKCVFGKNRDRIDVAIIGDSHANSIGYAVAQKLMQDGLTSTQISVSGCVPFRGYRYSNSDCDTVNRYIQDYVLNSDIKTLVIAGRYAEFLWGTAFDNGEGGVEHANFLLPDFLDHEGEALSAQQQHDYGLSLLKKGVEQFLASGKKIVLVYPIPEAGWTVPDRYFKERLADPGVSSLSTSIKAFEGRNRDITNTFDLIDNPALLKVRPESIFCRWSSGTRCMNAKGRDVYYSDDDHLSGTGARLVAGKVAEVIWAGHMSDQLAAYGLRK